MYLLKVFIPRSASSAAKPLTFPLNASYRQSLFSPHMNKQYRKNSRCSEEPPPTHSHPLPLTTSAPAHPPSTPTSSPLHSVILHKSHHHHVPPPRPRQSRRSLHRPRLLRAPHRRRHPARHAPQIAARAPPLHLRGRRPSTRRRRRHRAHLTRKPPLYPNLPPPPTTPRLRGLTLCSGETIRPLLPERRRRAALGWRQGVGHGVFDQGLLCDHRGGAGDGGA